MIISWSGGKDSLLALYEVQKSQDYEIVSLITTLTEDYDRVSMHGVRRTLLERQGESLGLPIHQIFLSKNASNEEYERKMKETLVEFQQMGVSTVVFGDIFLEDLRRYREENLSKIDMKGVFPIWKEDTTLLAHKFIDLGFNAVIACVDSEVLDRSFAGRVFDKLLLSDLPPTVDPCGENGEFHSFVYDGALFRQGVSHTVGETVLRDNRFYFCDLIPG